jgi:hypothetical protein
MCCLGCDGMRGSLLGSAYDFDCCGSLPTGGAGYSLGDNMRFATGDCIARPSCVGPLHQGN